MSLELSEDEKSTTKKVLEALEKQLKAKTNITYERYIFNSTVHSKMKILTTEIS
jgi:hypothetical protein